MVYPHTISPDEMSKGFIQLLKCADDLALDVPDAATLLGDFLARAVVDDVLPPALVRVNVRTLHCRSPAPHGQKPSDSVCLRVPRTVSPRQLCSTR